MFLFLKSLYYLRQSLALSPGLASHFQPQSLECWDYRHAPGLPDSSLFIREMEIKWSLQRVFERIKRILKVKVDAHSRCLWKTLPSSRPFLLRSCYHRNPLSWPSCSPDIWLGLHMTCSPGSSRELDIIVTEGCFDLIIFYRWCLLESLCESEIINKIN